jgi:Uma2 family endonuclease
LKWHSLFAASGVGFIWLVDPALRMVEVFRAVQGKPLLVTTAKDDDTGPLPPFDIEIPLTRFWLRRPPGEGVER